MIETDLVKETGKRKIKQLSQSKNYLVGGKNQTQG